MKLSKLGDLPFLPTSHDPQLKKKVLVPKGTIPKVMQVARIFFKPGQVANAHSHERMYETFLVEDGSGKAVVDGAEVELSKGSCITVEPGEVHELKNTGDKDWIVTIFGVATD